MTHLGTVVPILRIFDERKAREFYVDFLGFKVDFEHRFGDNFPLYLGVSHSGCQLHLSEHHGDGAPGIQIRIETDDVAGLAAVLAAKGYRYAKPGGPETTPWGTLELTISDPFGNRLRFTQPMPPSTSG
jgi:uncharacterized glyoxalase superfamily protein PhnB